MSDNGQKILPFEEFAEKFEQLDGPEHKLRSGIDYMRASLNNKKPPYFKGFWEARKLCFPLFKLSLEGPVRAELWNLYTELTREGRELKNMLDQETTFAVEQIDLAISSLEKELAEQSAHASELQFPEKLKALAHNRDYYCEKQNELSKLNLFAARVNSLRKELSKVEMRVRHKNKFFQRLSALGDLIFPRRKELIREISTTFESDVGQFVERHFSDQNFSADHVRRQVFFFREEIKQMQACAKLLTINTHAFSTTRLALSGCWDKLRGMEKELKKEFAQQKAQSTEKMEPLQNKIVEFEKSLADLEVPTAQKEADALLREISTARLTRDDTFALKEQLQKVCAPLRKKQQEEAEAAQNERQERQEAFTAKLEKLKEASIEQLSCGIEECRKELSTFSKSERLEFERQLRLLNDALAEKKEEALLALSADDRASLEALQGLLCQRQQQRREIKERLEELRKMSGGSALDIEKAMEINEQADSEKERLAKCDQAILDVEQKIEALKGS